jgi:hypothetical protein
VSLAVQNAQASEWRTNTGCFAIGQTDVRTNDLVVHYTVSGAASPSNDYVALPGTVVLPSNGSNALIVITPIANDVAEAPRDVVLTITPDPDYGIDVASGRVAIADMPIDHWRYSHFTSNQLAQLEISGDQADPNGNHVPNLMEYALGRSPLATNLAPVFTASLESVDGRSYFTAYYDRRVALLDATCAMEACTNLLMPDWVSGTDRISETIMASDGITERVRARVIAPPADTVDAQFLRLRVAHP